MRTLEPRRSFLVPIGCGDAAMNFIPREFFHVFIRSFDEQMNISVLPAEDQDGLETVLKRFSKNYQVFLTIFNTITSEIFVDPVLICPTWTKICHKTFRGRYALSYQAKIDLLYELVHHGHLKTKTIGIRTYVFREFLETLSDNESD